MSVAMVVGTAGHGRCPALLRGGTDASGGDRRARRPPLQRPREAIGGRRSGRCEGDDFDIDAGSGRALGLFEQPGAGLGVQVLLATVAAHLSRDRPEDYGRGVPFKGDSDLPGPGLAMPANHAFHHDFLRRNDAFHSPGSGS